MPAERPILMSAPMVRAILDDRKTQTRRLVKPQPHAVPWQTSTGEVDEALFWRYEEEREDWPSAATCPYGQPGDLLWVRETWNVVPSTAYARSEGVVQTPWSANPGISAIYRADWNRASSGVGWRPSIHMPKWAARLWLEVVEVRVERLQEISEEDAKVEGLEFHDGDGVGHSGWRHSRDHGFVYSSPIVALAVAWDEINGPGSWESNPWVWVVTFRRTEAPQKEAA